MQQSVESAPVGPWIDMLHRLSRNRLALASVVFLLVIGSVAVFAPFLSSFSYEETDLILGPTSPNPTHLFGTDDLGRDIFTRIMYGARVSLTVGLLSTAVSVLIGVAYGAIAGYCGGRIDNIMMRFVEIIYTLPFTVLVIVLMVYLGRSIYNLFIALGMVQWLTMARIVRGQIVSLREREFIEAARAIGVHPARVVFRHLVPNSIGPVIVYSTLTIPTVILEEAFLSFLGLGVQPPMSSWGTLIADGVSAMQSYPWMLVFPCLTLMATLFALNFLGDGLRDALDPRGTRG